MQELKLGIVACLHGKLTIARKLASKFKKLNVDGIIFNGDIPSDKNQYKSLIKILNIFLKTKKKIFIQPGSHEHYKDYTKALKKFKKIIDCSKIKKYNFKNYNLIFLPGSDVLSPGAGYKILKDRREINKFKRISKQRKDHFTGKIELTFISDLKNINKNSILFCHIPIRFNKKESIDVAKFATPAKDFTILPKHLKYSKTTGGELMEKKFVIFTRKEGIRLKKLGYPIKFKEKNIGNLYLKKKIKELKIKKFVCGHIHESGGKANDFKGNKLISNKWNKELFYNASSARENKAGLIILKDNLVKYKNLKI